MTASHQLVYLVETETWREGSFGTHAGDPGYIIQVLSEKLDKFLDWAVR